MAFAQCNLKTEITFSKSGIMKHNLYNIFSRVYRLFLSIFRKSIFLLKSSSECHECPFNLSNTKGFGTTSDTKEGGRPNPLVSHNSLDLGT